MTESQQILVKTPKAIELEKNGKYIFLMPENYNLFDALNICSDLMNIFSNTIQESHKKQLEEAEKNK